MNCRTDAGILGNIYKMSTFEAHDDNGHDQQTQKDFCFHLQLLKLPFRATMTLGAMPHENDIALWKLIATDVHVDAALCTHAPFNHVLDQFRIPAVV